MDSYHPWIAFFHIRCVHYVRSGLARRWECCGLVGSRVIHGPAAFLRPGARPEWCEQRADSFLSNRVYITIAVGHGSIRGGLGALPWRNLRGGGGAASRQTRPRMRTGLAQGASKARPRCAQGAREVCASGVQGPPKARPRRAQGARKGARKRRLKRAQGAPKVPPRRAQGAPKARPTRAQCASNVHQTRAQGAPNARPRRAQGAPKASPRCAQRAPKARPRCAQGARKVRPRCARGAREWRPRCAQGVSKARPRCAQGARKVPARGA